MLCPMSRPLLIAAMIGLCACAPPPLPSGGDDSQGADAAPSITIVYPESSQTEVYCPTFLVVVDIEGFTLSPIVDEPVNVEGEGHWHLLDSADYITAADKEYVEIPGGKALSAGTHSLVATLANNDHQPLDPVVAYSIEIVVGDTQTDGVTPCEGGGGGSSGGDTDDSGMGY